ncbi:MAG: murein biosynthesis integral membrane protein MurJ [Rhodobacteraceae bacterium]|nr:murein biosynthesis integral membrane protein MurJ [Paracoccaceae bacterium]
MKPIRLLSGFLTVGGWTMASRVLGFARDILIAATMGSGPVGQAFLVAFALPNMFRRFFAEGAFNMAFVPLFSKKLERGEDAKGFATEAFAGLATLLAVFSAVAIVAMPLLVLAMASGFAGDVRFELAVTYGRICFAYILFISLGALLSGVLNALGHFAAAAAAPVLLNVILIAALLLAESGVFLDTAVIEATGTAALTGAHQATLLVWGVLFAGVAQLSMLWWAAHRAGYGLRPARPRFTPEMKRLLVLAAPAALAGGVVQINLLVGRQVASFFDGAVFWLGMADRLYQLPLGVVGIAVGIVLLPDLSRRIGAGDDAGGRAAFSRAGEISLALTLPAAMALCVIPGPLVSVLYERGAFTAADTAATALAVAIYGAGLPAFVLQKVLQPLFYAREDTRRPFRYAAMAMLVNAAVAIGLAPLIGWIAAALATTLAGWALVGLLLWGARDMGDTARFDARFAHRLPRQVLACIVMGLCLLVLRTVLSDALTTPTLRYGALALLVGGGAASYFAAAHLLGALRLSELKSALRRS